MTIQMIQVPVGDTDNATMYNAKVIYHKKGSVWAITKLADNYWDQDRIKKSKQYSSITYVKDGHHMYGRTTSTYKVRYIKGIPYNDRRMTQKELIQLCKQFNKDGVTYESLANMRPIDRKKLFGQL